MIPANIDLADIISLKEWQDIQDSLAEVLELTIRTISPDVGSLTRVSRQNRICSEILQNFPNHSKLCPSLLTASNAEALKNIKRDINIECPFDLDAFVVPIKAVGDKIIAYVVLGPIILKKRKSISEYAKEAERFGITTDVLEDALIDIKVFSYNKINMVIRLIKDVFSHIAQTGYHKKRLGEIAPKVVELDPMFSAYYEEKILKSLLDACILALGADSGSVMTLDNSTNMLQIKAASRLDDNIVHNTHMRLGEGIAGVAAATLESIILPADKNKNGIAGKMKRADINSSVIMPFSKGDSQDVYGVINLNILRKDSEFSKKNIAFIKELVNMTSIALIPLKTLQTK